MNSYFGIIERENRYLSCWRRYHIADGKCIFRAGRCILGEAICIFRSASDISVSIISYRWPCHLISFVRYFLSRIAEYRIIIIYVRYLSDYRRPYSSSRYRGNSFRRFRLRQSRSRLPVSMIHSMMTNGVIGCLNNQDRILIIPNIAASSSDIPLIPSDILSSFIRHRYNNQRCRIAAYPIAFRVIYTRKRNRFTHTAAAYTRKRNRFTHTTTAYTRKRNWFTHKNTSEWLICESKVSHFMPSSDFFTNKFPIFHHAKRGTFGNLRGRKRTRNASFFTKYRQWIFSKLFCLIV